MSEVDDGKLPTYWRGKPCWARKVSGVVATWTVADRQDVWWRQAVGQRRDAVEVTLQNGEVFYLDDQGFAIVGTTTEYGVPMAFPPGSGWSAVLQRELGTMVALVSLVPETVTERGLVRDEGSESEAPYVATLRRVLPDFLSVISLDALRGPAYELDLPGLLRRLADEEPNGLAGFGSVEDGLSFVAVLSVEPMRVEGDPPYRYEVLTTLAEHWLG